MSKEAEMKPKTITVEEAGREYFGLCRVTSSSAAPRGDVRFHGGKSVEHRIGYIRDRHKFAERSSLGYTEEVRWEKDSRGRPIDPWSQQTYLPLQHAETGELYTFVFRSAGALQCF